MRRLLLWSVVVLTLAVVGLLSAIGYGIYDFTRPVEVVALDTPWTKLVDPDAPLQEYPRPQLRRENWQNLNGRWQYSVTDRAVHAPASFDDEIVVPFAFESMLSGVAKALSPDARLWYRKVFATDIPNSGERLILHFGAVDWEAEVWLNGNRLGIHRGGYSAFSFDITSALKPGTEQELVVAVWDPTNLGPGAYGKQHLVPHGIRYTPVSGIWQTVWLEAVPSSRIEKVTSATQLSKSEVTIRIETAGAMLGDELEVLVYAKDQLVEHRIADIIESRASVRFAPENLRLWSPEDPFLYDIKARLVRDGRELDAVASYFGAREVRTGQDGRGITRLFLNGRPIFHLGLLDQGWWPDGLYTAPTDEALAFDIAATRQMGFNSIRKHVKVEPARWYWHADRAGVLVWQDMPTGDGGAGRYRQILRQSIDILAASTTGSAWRHLDRPAESATQYRQELADMIDQLEFFPSIVAWVPFNEAWGQFETDEILSEVKARDPHRITDGPSGWFDSGSGDVRDLHVYGREAGFVDELPVGRALVYGEFGGLALPVKNHLPAAGGWGYADYENDQSFETAYMDMLSIIEELIPRGLSGAIYTQTTDVESEINGLMTYDRRVFKIEPEKLATRNRRLTSFDDEGASR